MQASQMFPVMNIMAARKSDDASLKCNHDHGNNQICQSLGAWTVNYADDFLRTDDLSILFYINS
jgi:hypothetical protein